MRFSLLDVVTLVGAAPPPGHQEGTEPAISPGIVVGVTEMDGRDPSLTLIVAMPAQGGGFLKHEMPNVPSIKDDPRGTYRYRLREDDDFAPQAAAGAAQPIDAATSDRLAAERAEFAKH